MQRSRTAFRLLQVGLAAVLAAAGADKLFHASAGWDLYLPLYLPWLLGTSPESFLRIIGLAEIGLAFGLALRPRAAGMLCAFWFLLIAFTLVSGGKFVGLGLLNVVLAILAFAESTLASGETRETQPRDFWLRPIRFRRPTVKYPQSLPAQ